MGHRGLCYLNQRAADSQPAEAGGIRKSAASFSGGREVGGKRQKAGKQDNDANEDGKEDN